MTVRPSMTVNQAAEILRRHLTMRTPEWAAMCALLDHLLVAGEDMRRLASALEDKQMEAPAGDRTIRYQALIVLEVWQPDDEGSSQLPLASIRKVGSEPVSYPYRNSCKVYGEGDAVASLVGDFTAIVMADRAAMGFKE